MAAKRLELLHELIPGVTSVAYLINPTSAIGAAIEMQDVEAAARQLGLSVLILNARDQSEFELSFRDSCP